MKQLLGLIVVLLAALPVAGGVVFEVESNAAGTASEAEISIDGLLMKMDTASAKGDWNGDMIFRGDRHEMVIVNHDDKSYFVIDQQQMRDLSAKVNQAMSSMEQALSALPESQRARMEQMMKSRMPDMGTPREPSTLEKTGETDTINGYPCVKYIVKRSGKKERELWVTDWDNVSGGKDAAKVFYEMAEFMTEMLDSLPKMGNGQSFGDATYEHMKEMNGFPVRTLEFGDNGMVDSESSLKSSREADLDAALFEPPKKYKRKDLMKGMR